MEIRQAPAHYVGVDGCKGGWFAVSLTKDGGLTGTVYPDIAVLMAACKPAAPVLIDIPIGLPDREKRQVESLARQRLGPRAYSVFPVPSRAALQADDYPMACQVNREKMGKALSKQSWFIGPKILEVDAYLAAHPHAQASLRECHPELAFWALGGGQPMAHAKKTQEGQQARLALLSAWVSDAEAFFQETLKQYKRKDLLADDILDALCLAITASHYPDWGQLPESMQYDLRVLPMEMVYSTRRLTKG
ncbi:MAG: DUF429 domain-containing protein [Bacteroidota bacterium]